MCVCVDVRGGGEEGGGGEGECENSARRISGVFVRGRGTGGWVSGWGGGEEGWICVGVFVSVCLACGRVGFVRG